MQAVPLCFSPLLQTIVFPYRHNFVVDPQIIDERHVHYRLDINHDRWPWLTLPPHHPSLIGKHSFFVGVGCALDLLQLPPETASALTEVHWTNWPDCFVSDHARSAQAQISQEDERFHFACELLNAGGDLIQTMEAWGVMFQHRDYGSWRDKIKQAIERTRPEDFNFADMETAGLRRREECFVSPLHEGRKGLSCYALLDAASGFVPQHPWHTGTGDHVNASQLLDVAYQSAHLVAHAQGWWSPGQAMRCNAGEARFRKYIELSAPFEITLTGYKPLLQGRSLHLGMQQNGKSCAEIVLALQTGD